MDSTKDGGSVNRPRVLDDTNYENYKAKIVSFVKSMDNRTQKVVVKGYKNAMNISQDDTSSLKPKSKWTDANNNEALGNFKALNAIFICVDQNMFRLINTYIEAKDAWKILKKLLIKAHPRLGCQGYAMNLQIATRKTLMMNLTRMK